MKSSELPNEESGLYPDAAESPCRAFKQGSYMIIFNF